MFLSQLQLPQLRGHSFGIPRVEGYLVSGTQRTLRYVTETSRESTTAETHDVGEGETCRGWQVVRTRSGTYRSFNLNLQYLDLRLDTPLIAGLMTAATKTTAGSFTGKPLFLLTGLDTGVQKSSYQSDQSRHLEISGGTLVAPLTIGSEEAGQADTGTCTFVRWSPTCTQTSPSISGSLADITPGLFAVDGAGNFLVSFPQYNAFISYPEGAGATAGITTPVPVGVD